MVVVWAVSSKSSSSGRNEPSLRLPCYRSELAAAVIDEIIVISRYLPGLGVELALVRNSLAVLRCSHVKFACIARG